LLVDDRLQQRLELRNTLRRALVARLESIRLRVASSTETISVDFDELAGTNLRDVLEESPLEQRRVEVEIIVEPVRIEFSPYIRSLEQRLDFAREHYAPAVVVVIELFYAERVARQNQPPCRAVPERKREDSRRL